MSSMLDINDFVQELIANTVEHIVEIYELPSGDMDMNTGARLVQIGDELAGILKEFVEDNRK